MVPQITCNPYMEKLLTAGSEMNLNTTCTDRHPPTKHTHTHTLHPFTQTRLIIHWPHINTDQDSLLHECTARTRRLCDGTGQRLTPAACLLNPPSGAVAGPLLQLKALAKHTMVLQHQGQAHDNARIQTLTNTSLSH